MDKQTKFQEILQKYSYNPSNYSLDNSVPEQQSAESRLAELKSIANESKQEVEQEKKPLFQRTIEKIADFTGGKELGQGIAQTINLPEASKQLDSMLEQATNQQSELLAKRKELKATGGDTSAIDKALNINSQNLAKIGAGAEALLNPNDLTAKQIIGDALQLGTTIIGAGTLPGATKTVTGASTFTQGAIQGAKTGALAGAGFGGATGVSQGLQEDKTLGQIAIQGVTGAVTGALTGGLIGGVTGGISGAIKGKQLRNKVLEGQVSLGQKNDVDLNTLNPIQKKAVSIAKTQGFDDTDIKFMLSMKPEDKIKANKMVELAQKASLDKRVTERPIDIVGDSMIERVKFIQSQNSKSGKLVDTTAKALKGQTVNASPIREKALSLLEEVGVSANPDGTPNWSKSIFNKTPELKNKIMKTLSDLPAGEIDAYDLHNFKKSIDEVVNYGIKGEGLKGKSANILKAVRNSADEVLDSTFSKYNKANTDYKNTREVLDQVNDLFGKKVGISKERGGQLLRSVFSNNTQRPRVLQLVEQLDNVSEQYGKKFNDNLLDQTLFTEILEDIYGTQATTALQGQVARAVKGTKKVIEGVRNPLQGVGELLASGAEKIAGITPENKKKILNAFLK